MVFLNKHQTKVVDFITKPYNRSIFVYHSTGSGKTLTALMAADKIFKTNPKINIIIITSNSTINQWKSEYIRFINPKIPEHVYFFTHNYLSNNIFELEKCRNAVVIIDEIHILRTTLKKETFYNELGFKLYLNMLPKEDIETLKNKKFSHDYERWNYLIVLLNLNNIEIKDEYKYTKKSKTVWYNYLAAKVAHKVILMSATPFINSEKDFDNLCLFLTDKKYRDADTCLKNINVSYYDKSEDKQYMEDHFPKIIEKIIDVEMSPQERARYNNIFSGKEKIEGWEDVHGSQFMVKLNQMRMAGDASFEVYFSPKMKILNEIIKTKKVTKMLIYTSWVVNGVSVLLKSLDERISDIYVIKGGMTAKAITNVVNDFNKPPNIKNKIIIITSAGKEGLNLKSVTDVFILEPGWNYASENQALSRAIRYNSHIDLPKHKQVVTIYRMLLGRESVDWELFERYIVPKKKEDEKWAHNFKKISI